MDVFDLVAFDIYVTSVVREIPICSHLKTNKTLKSLKLRKKNFFCITFVSYLVRNHMLMARKTSLFQIHEFITTI